MSGNLLGSESLDFLPEYDNSEIMKYFSACFLMSIVVILTGLGELHPFRSIEVGAKPLHWAAANGASEKIKKLISEGKNVNLKADMTNATPLHFAAWRGQYNSAKLLIGLGANVNAKTDYGDTPLHYAAGMETYPLGSPGEISPGLSEGHTEVVKLLVEHGADVNLKDREESTALMEAAARNAVDIAQILIDHGADVDARGAQYTALEIASSRGPDVAKLLIKNGADVNTQATYVRTSPLHAAVGANFFFLTQLLLEHRANPNAQTRTGATPLHYAATTEMAELLIEYGADVDMADQNGWTPLHAAIIENSFPMAQMFLQHGADANAKDHKGATPLHRAVWMRRNTNVEIIELLLQHGANVNIKDNSGRTPLRETTDAKIKEMLQN